MKNIAVLASGTGTNLQCLINNMDKINGKIVLVVSSKEDTFALHRARDAKIDSIVIKSSDENSDEVLLGTLKKYSVDLVVLAGYMHILSKSIIDTYKDKIINIHPSLIPSFCGKGYYGIKVAEAMIEYGVKIAGATVHFVDEGADTGPIILQGTVKVSPKDTPKLLQSRILNKVEHKILPQAVQLFCDDKLSIDGRVVKIKE